MLDNHKYLFDAKEVASVIGSLQKAGFNAKALDEIRGVTAKYKPEDAVAYAQFIHTLYNHPETLQEWLEDERKTGCGNSLAEYAGARGFFVFVTTD
jgi:LPS O-antigen subunit length determinant protein (WzzB/FepE family)